MKILAIDHGTKRIGLAISDELGIVAAPLEIISTKKDRQIQKVSEVYKEQGAEKILLGIPLNPDGTVGKQGEIVKEFGEELKSGLKAEIVYWDEYLSSKQAERKKKSKRTKENLDSEAARIILQEYLDTL